MWPIALGDPLCQPAHGGLLSLHGGSQFFADRLGTTGRLRATTNVWVNDASLLPDAPGVNPQASVMAVGIRNVRHYLENSR